MQAIVFDLDGVVVDTESTDFVAWDRAYREHGQTLPRDAWVNAIGEWHKRSVTPCRAEPGDPRCRTLLGSACAGQIARQRLLLHEVHERCASIEALRFESPFALRSVDERLMATVASFGLD